MVFQYSPAGFEEYFIENGTPAGMPAKERTEEEYALPKKNMEWFIKTSCKDFSPSTKINDTIFFNYNYFIICSYFFWANQNR